MPDGVTTDRRRRKSTGTRHLTGWLAVLLLAACGSDTTRLEDLKLLKGVFNSAFGLNEPAANPVLSRAQVDRDGLPLLRVRLESRDQVAFLGRIGENAGAVTWASTDGITLSLRGGVVIASRGFGNDLMSAAVPTPEQLASGSTHTRRHYYLFGGETEVLRGFDCVMSGGGTESVVVVELRYQVNHRIETCTAKGGGDGFSNEYWFDGRGIIRQSRQWIAPSVGYLELQDVKR